MTKNTALILGIGLIILAGGIAVAVIYANKDDNNQQSSQASNESQQTSQEVQNENIDETPVSSPGETQIIKKVSVEARSYSFTPATIEVNAGDTLQIEISNMDGTHDFVIDELDINSGLLDEGTSKLLQIKIPSDASGKTYEFYCSVSNHRAMGMVGVIKVK